MPINPAPRLIATLASCALAHGLWAQCAADAGAAIVAEPGMPVTLGATPAGTGTGNLTFQWAPAIGLSDTNEPNPVVIVQPGITTYTLQVTDGDGCTATSITTVEGQPGSIFNLSSVLGCAPLNCSVSSLGFDPGQCGTFFWTVETSPVDCTAEPSWTFAGGTNATDAQPAFQFMQPGTYTVRLLLDGACGTSTHDKTVVVQGAPFASLAPLGTICAGQCVEPEAMVQSCASPVDSWSWSFPGANVATSTLADPGTICYPTAGAQVITLTLGNTCGSSTTFANVVISPAPAPPTVSSNSPICAGQTLALTATPVPGAGIQWSGPGGFSSNQGTVTIPSVQAGHSGTYTATAVGMACSSAPATVEVVVNPAPTVTVTPSAVSICAGQSATLSAGGAPSLQWFIGAVQVGSGPQLTTSPAITTTYTVTGNAGGCPGSATATVVVLPLPSVNTGPPQTFCDQAIPVQLSGWPAPGTWSGPFVSPTGSFTPQPGSTGVFPVTYSHTGANGCTNTSTMNVTVQALPAVAQLAPDLAICVGMPPMQLTASPPGGTWSANAPNGLFTPNGAGSHTVTYSIGTGTCQSTAQQTISVQPATVPQVMSPFQACTNDPSVALTASPSGGVWSGPGVVDGVFQPSGLAPGNHTLAYTLTEPNGCVNTAQTTATVLEAPAVNAGGDLQVCDQPVPVPLAATPAGGSWSAGWMNVTPAGELVPNGTGSDVLTYTYTAPNGCTAASTIAVQVASAPVPPVIAAMNALCVGAAPAALQASPAGGVWSGDFTTPTGQFDPQQAGLSTVAYTVGTGSCAATSTMGITVHPLPTITFQGPLLFCGDAAPTLVQALPAGGAWSGVGIAPDGGVDPAALAQGSYPVTYSVVDPLTGCAAMQDTSITVAAVPQASFVPPALLCSGSAAVFTSTSTAVVEHSWEFGDGAQGSGGVVAHSFAQGGAFQVAHTVTNAEGCTHTTTLVLDVTDPPQALFTPSVSDGCGPLAVSFANTSSGQGASYLWDLGPAGTSTQEQPAPVVYAADPAGTVVVPVSLTVTNTCGASTLNMPITVRTSPTAVLGGQPITVCALSQVLLSEASYGEPTAWTWDFGNGATSAGPGQVSVTYGAVNAPTTYSVQLTVANACGSSSTIQQVEVLPAAVSASFSTDVLAGCGPLEVTFSQQSLGDTAWVWNFGDGTMSTVRDPLHVFAAPGTYTVLLTSTGCSTVQSATTITVHPDPVAAIVADDQSVCVGVPVELVADAPPGTLLNWSLGDGSNADQPTVVHVYGGAGQYTCTLDVLDPATGCGTVLQLPIVVHPLPVASFVSTPMDACANEPVYFTSTSSGAVQHTWTLSDGTTLFGPQVEHVFGTEGLFGAVLLATSAEGCASTLAQPDIITVRPAPVAAFRHVQEGSVRLVHRFIDESIGAVTQLWDMGDGSVVGGDDVRHTYDPDGGRFVVCLTVSNDFGCQDTSCRAIIVEPDPLPWVPNAFTPDGDGINDVFLPMLNGFRDADYLLLVHDRWGEPVFTSTDRGRGWDGTMRGRDAAPGVYVWRMELRGSGEGQVLSGHVTLVR